MRRTSSENEAWQSALGDQSADGSGQAFSGTHMEKLGFTKGGHAEKWTVRWQRRVLWTLDGLMGTLPKDESVPAACALISPAKTRSSSLSSRHSPRIDTDHLSLDTFRELVMDNGQKLKTLVEEWDEDASSTISTKEFRSALKSLGFTASDAHMDALFDELDKDRSGQLDYREMIKAIKAKPRAKIKRGLVKRSLRAMIAHPEKIDLAESIILDRTMVDVWIAAAALMSTYHAGLHGKCTSSYCTPGTHVYELSSIATYIAIAAVVIQLGLCLRFTRVAVRLMRQSARVVKRSLKGAHEESLRSLLRSGDIRLLRCSWLVSQTSDAKLERDAAGRVIMSPMQKLLADAPEAFFSPEEAEELFDRGDRSIFGLSHAWQTLDNPDPHGWTLSALRMFLRGPWESTSAIDPEVDVRWQGYLKDLESSALFWDWVSVPQPLLDGGKRRFDEQLAYERARDHVLSLFASALGTCVLSMRHVPAAEVHGEAYERRVRIDGLSDGVDEVSLSSYLKDQAIAAPVACRIDHSRTSATAELCFSSEADARLALWTLQQAGVAASLVYDPTPYEERGWTACEMFAAQAISAHISRMGSVPKELKRAEDRRPKLIDITQFDRPMPIAPPLAPSMLYANARGRLKTALFRRAGEAKEAQSLLEILSRRLNGTLSYASSGEKRFRLEVVRDARALFLTKRFAPHAQRSQGAIWLMMASLFVMAKLTVMPETWMLLSGDYWDPPPPVDSATPAPPPSLPPPSRPPPPSLPPPPSSPPPSPTPPSAARSTTRPSCRLSTSPRTAASADSSTPRPPASMV
jgi:hypothetical protein